jgi:Protein of unknown function (DUF3630)
MVIRFRNPKLERMHSGNLCIELSEGGTWESFEGFAEQWAAQIGAQIHDRVDGPDVRVWRIVYAGHTIRLVYSDYPRGISVEAIAPESDAAIQKLFSVVSSEAAPHGV